jgi:hypothetical protein
MSKGREPQIILKTDQRTVVLELGVGGKFAAKSSRLVISGAGGVV